MARQFAYWGRLSFTVRAALCIGVMLPLAGCDPDTAYLASILQNTLTSYSQLRPIDDVIADGSVTPEQADKLRLVQKIRNYAGGRVGLTVGDAYSKYLDNGDAEIGYALLASHPDQFKLYEFDVPLFGPADTKAFYDRDMADAESDRLKAEGYDVFLAVVEGFSTLGMLSDPIRSSDLSRDEAALAEVILHELLHKTVYKRDDSDFNESVATFIGRTAAEQFLIDEFGADSPIAIAGKNRFSDHVLVDAAMESLHQELEALYSQSIDREAKLVARETVFAAARLNFNDVIKPQLHEPARFSRFEKLETNNAMVLASIRYQGGLELFRQVYDATGRDFPSTIAVLKSAAEKSDSRGWIAQWLVEHGITPIL